MKAILCALDFSDASEEALKEALKLAAEKRTGLIVLYTYRLLHAKGLEVSEYRRNIEKKARQNFEVLFKKLNLNPAVACEFIIEIGFLSDRIEALIKRNKVEYLVLCEKLAASMIEQQGLSFEQFSKALNIPVLIIPEAMKVN